MQTVKLWPATRWAPMPSSGDDTAALQAWFNSIPDHSTVVLPMSRVYRVDGSLRLHRRQGLRIIGNGATFRAETLGSPHATILLTDCRRVHIEDLNIIGDNPDPGFNGGGTRGNEGRHGISIRSSSSVDVIGCSISNVWADFVYVGVTTMATQVWSKDVTVADCTLSGNGRQAFGIVAVDGMRVQRCAISEVRQSCFDLEPNSTTTGAFRVMLADNTISRVRLVGLACGGYPGRVERVSVLRNTVTSGAFQVRVIPPTGVRRGPFMLHGNTVAGHYGNPSGSAWSFRSCDGVTVKNNVVPVEAGRGMAMLHTVNCSAVWVSGNESTNADPLWVDWQE